MFISIRWKAVIFLSLVLFVITVAWVTQSIYQNLNNYESAISKHQMREQNVLSQLINDNYLRLSQYAQLIVDQPALKNSENDKNFIITTNFLKNQLFAWNLNLGIDYVALFNQDEVRIAEAYEALDQNQFEELNKFIRSFISQAQNTPFSFMFCQVSCMQFVMEPFVFANGQTGVLVLGQNINGLLTRYHSLSNSDLAITLEVSQDQQNELYLNDWGVRVWAMSRFDEMFSVIKEYSRNYPLDYSYEMNLFKLWNNQFLVQEIELNNFIQVGTSSNFITVLDVSSHQDQLRLEIWNEIFLGFIAWFLAEIMLIALTLGPIQRLVRIVKALEVLPNHEYDKANSLVEASTSFIKDELTQLEDSTVHLASKLQSLHAEVEVSKDNLESKIMMLTRSKSFLQRLFDNANLYILTQNFTFEQTSHNQFFSEDFLMDDQQSFLSLFTSPYDKKNFKRGVLRLSNQTEESFQQEVLMDTKTGGSVTLVWTHTLVNDDNGNNQILSIGMDITQRKKDEEALQWLANNDSLTEIGNRRSFQTNLEHALATLKKGAVVFIDVNRFKQINDIYGHFAGDMVLIDIANQLKEHTRVNDYISRLAGDEFTMILPGVDENSLPNILANLSERLHREVNLPNNDQIEYSVSIGAALFPNHGKDEQALIVHSDLAMYKAKQKGLHQWHIFDNEDGQVEALREEHKISEFLKQAVKENLLNLVFQPIYSVKEKFVSHYEVLLRANLENGDPISPGVFIPIAERVGLIRDIDYWVLEHALLILHQKMQEQPELKFAINVSAPTLQDPGFFKKFKQLVSKASVPAENIILELTETAYVDNFMQVLRNLDQVVTLGSSIALDDFGVGYSSFSYLQRLPLKYIKLDGSYVQNLCNNPESEAFIKSVVIMAEAFNMFTVAEFVEDKETFDALELLNIDYIQGYLVGKPDSSTFSSPSKSLLFH